jgi:cytochrome b
MTSKAGGDALHPRPETQRVKLWDLPIRVVHWSFALLLPALWWTWKSGHMPVHRVLGYTMLGLLIFRLYWGLAGSSPARFVSFVRGPRAILAYLRGLCSRDGATMVGHNPVGGWSVVALLGMLVVQVTLGLFAQDTDGLESGPLTQYVSYEFADRARDLHEIGFNLLLGLVALHLCAIVFHLVVKRDNLVGPMVTGHRKMGALADPPRFVPARRAILGVALSAAIAWWISQGCPIPGL